MEAQIMKLEAPFDYIYCNGEVGKHIGTYIVGESHVGKDGTYTLETHSHPIVQYFNSPKGVVWNKPAGGRASAYPLTRRTWSAKSETSAYWN